MKKHNFSAGPAILPQEVLQKAAEAVKELDGIGLSLIEISHRSKEFISIMDEAQSLVLELLGLQNKGYRVLFLQGGASMQFLMVAQNLLENKAGYLNTGTWSTKALKEAKLFGEALEVASSKAENFNHIPKQYTLSPDLDYFHITTNNTIFGTQIKTLPETTIPLVADMSSDIFSKPFPYDQLALFYAGAQKNMGPAGTTLVVVKEDILGKVSRTIPSMLDYRVHIDKESMFNTPPVFAVYTSLLNLRWIKAQGGLTQIGKRNEEKAQLLYAEIDRNPCFVGFAAAEDRSWMNVTFNLKDPDQGAAFDALWTAAGISGLKGHRSVGGYRASIYNALSLDSIHTLIACMQDFEKQS